jgi:hypothetical protein
MSKHNKVNKSNYDQAGRLTPDEMARERVKQGEAGRASGDKTWPGKTSQPRGDDSVPTEPSREQDAAPEPNRPRSAPEE